MIKPLYLASRRINKTLKSPKTKDEIMEQLRSWKTRVIKARLNGDTEREKSLNGAKSVLIQRLRRFPGKCMDCGTTIKSVAERCLLHARTHGKRKLIAGMVLVSFTAFSDDVNFGWKNGLNPNATTNWQSIVYVSTVQNPGPSNFISSAVVQWPKTNAIVSNIPSGTKTYTQVYHFDLEDLSDPSNQVFYKTKMNAPSNATKLP